MPVFNAGGSRNDDTLGRYVPPSPECVDQKRYSPLTDTKWGLTLKPFFAAL